MNKLQQEIIEIIEPYMDKTLSEGCLIELLDWDKYRKHFRIIEDLCKDWDSPSMNFRTINVSNIRKAMDKWIEHLHEDWDDYKIIWHYDITAVLKYINENKNFDWRVDINWWINLYTIGDDYSDVQNFTELPYKPLHLYTEQENKDLLELLKKLWKITDQDKVNHYVNNLSQYIMLWEMSFWKLYSDVKKVQKNPKFHEFCIEKYNEWKIQVKILYDYFKNPCGKK